MEEPKVASARKAINWELIREWLGVLAFIVSTVGVWTSIHFFNAEQKAQYRISQLEYRPNLIVSRVGTWPDFKFEKVVGVDSTGTLDIEASLTVQSQFHLINIGNATASLQGYIFLDTTTGRSIIHDILTSDREREQGKLLPDWYFEDININPGDSFVIEHVYPIQFLDSTSFSIHALFFYENELKQLFDSYYIGRYLTKELIMYPDIDQSKQPVLKVSKRDVENYLVPVDNNRTSTRNYSKEEREKVHKYFDRLYSKNGRK